MKEKVLWKRIVVFGLTAAMLMTGVSAGYAEEVSVIPNELAGISSFAEDVDPDSADTDIIEDVTNKTPETVKTMSSTRLIEDQDLVAADDDSEKIEITFDGGEGSNYQGEYDEDIWEYPYDGGSTYVETIYPGDSLWILGSDSFRAEGKRLIGWKNLDTDEEYEFGEYRIFDTSTTLTAVWEEAIKITFDGGEGSNYRGEYDEDLDEYPYDGGSTYVLTFFSDDDMEVEIPDSGDFKKAGQYLKGWVDLNTGIEYECDEEYLFTSSITLTAIWVPGVMVTFDLNGGNSYGSLSFSQVIEKDIIIGDHFYYGTGITPPAGKTFVGWSLKRNDTSSKISTYKLTQNVTLFALWKASDVKPSVPADVKPSVPADKITITKTPSGVKAKAAKKGKATLTWKKFKQTKKTKAIWKRIKNVEVQYSTDKTFRTGVISKKLGKKKTKLNVKKLKAKTTYYFRVRYVEGPYKVSKWSAVKKVKAKK